MDPEDHGPDSEEGDGPEHKLSSGQLGGDGDRGAGHRAGTAGAPGKRRLWVRSPKAALSLVLGSDRRCSAIQRLSAWGRLCAACTMSSSRPREVGRAATLIPSSMEASTVKSDVNKKSPAVILAAFCSSFPG